MIMTWPKREKSFGVSLTISPVTQTEDAEVKRASMIPIPCPSAAENGNERRRVPRVIRARNPLANTCAGVQVLNTSHLLFSREDICLSSRVSIWNGDNSTLL